MTLAAPLAKFLGKTEELPRTEVTKLLWKYIKEKDLQNPDNRKEILCDPKLKSLFKVDAFTMFQMATLLKPVSVTLTTNVIATVAAVLLLCATVLLLCADVNVDVGGM